MMVSSSYNELVMTTGRQRKKSSTCNYVCHHSDNGQFNSTINFSVN